MGILTRYYSENKCKHDAGVRGITQQPTCGLLDPAMITTQRACGMHWCNPGADRQTDRLDIRQRLQLKPQTGSQIVDSLTNQSDVRGAHILEAQK